MKVNHILSAPFVLRRNFSHVNFSHKLKPLRIGPYKILDRLSDVTYKLLSQGGSRVHVHRNHLIPYSPKELFLYPHLRSFLRFSDSTQFYIPKPIKFANSDSSPLIPMNLYLMKIHHRNHITPSTTSNDDFTTLSLIDNSPIKQYDNSPFENIIKTPQTDIPYDRSRHPSQDQSNLLPPPIDRTTKTHDDLRHQPKIDYTLFIPLSKLSTQSLILLAQQKLVDEK